MVQLRPYVVHLAIVHEILDIEHISAQREKWNVPTSGKPKIYLIGT
jgi:hypothetical protein